MPNISTETYRINVENAGYALVTTNTSVNYLLGTKVSLPGLRSIDLTLQLASGKLYGDGSIACNIAQATGATVKVDINKIAIENRAKMLGQTYDNGILDVKAGDTAPLMALYVEVVSDQGTKEQMWFLCGVAQPFGLTGQQREDNINFSTDSMTVEFKPRMLDKKIYRLGDTANADFTSAHSLAFASNPDATGTTVTATLGASTFDKNASGANYADVTLTVNTGNILYIKANENYIPVGSMSVTGYVATIKKEYLATLDEGDVMLTACTDVGNASAMLKVENTSV